ncbi:MAG: hypothetical protein HY784_14360 [Chloroflexi bacterium]|nr:hypothetical protein [Chloroflexota bacterium]
MYAANQLLFPPEVIPVLGELRGGAWRELVRRVSLLPETHPESLAFTLMMIRLDGCMECETDSFRAMRGCEACALQTIRRFKRSDDDLLARYQAALRDVIGFLQVGPAAARVRISAR